MASPLRRLWHNPEKILGPHLHVGMSVLEPGPGMGYFTLPAARLVGPGGRVVAVDIQPKMLEGLRRRAVKAGVGPQVETRLATEGLGLTDLSGGIDFALLFAMVHEVPEPQRLFAEVSAALKPGGRVLFAEPAGHVTAEAFARELGWAAECGLKAVQKLEIARSQAMLLEKVQG